MGKFCGKCGAELKEDFCTNCGAKASDVKSNGGVSSDVNEYFKQKMDNKRKHNVYRAVVGAIMVFLGICFIIATFSEDAMSKYELLDYNTFLAFTLPGILILIGGFFSCFSTKCNPLLLVSGILYAIAGLSNLIGIEDISLLLILCAVFAPVNIIYFVKTNKLQN